MESEDSASFQDAKHFFDRDLRAWREDVRELTEHHVEFAVSEGKLLHVAFLPHDTVQVADGRVLLGDGEELRREVDAGDNGAGSSRRYRHDARAAPHVQHLLPGPNACEEHEPGRAWSRRLGERRERLPDLPLSRLDRL